MLARELAISIEVPSKSNSPIELASNNRLAKPKELFTIILGDFTKRLYKKSK